jgi:membrane protease YdiL (CAAX protease family)
MDVSKPFDKRRHLLFAVVALVILAVMVRTRVQWVALLFGASLPWDAPETLLYRSVALLPLVALAWLAFDVFDTHAGVTLIGPKWWRIGWEPWVVFVPMVIWYIGASRYGAPEAVAEIARTLSPYYDEPVGRVAWGLVFASKLMGVLAEELVFRAFLQRALEGYMRKTYANVAQALVFELVHLYVYGYPFYWGFYLFWGLAFGAAFQRTRSLLGPVMLHVTGNMIHAIAFSAALTGR